MDWKTYFDYDPIGGKLIWSSRMIATRSGRSAKASKRFVGKEAGMPSKRRGVVARVVVDVNAKPYSVHRIVWEMHNGPIPDGLVIDHIDRNPLNNRLENLRLATIGQNNMNNNIYKNNTSSMRGVSWCKLTSKWLVQVRLNGKHVILKRFTSLADAKEVHARVAKQSYGEFIPNEQLEIIKP
jgi:hypothetical protein